MTQARLGQLVGYAAETIRKVEADELRLSRQMAEKLAEALAIPLDERERFVRFARDQMAATSAPLPQPALPLPPLPGGERPQPLPLPRDPLFGRTWEVATVESLLLRPEVAWARRAWP